MYYLLLICVVLWHQLPNVQLATGARHKSWKLVRYFEYYNRFMNVINIEQKI